MNRKTLLLAAMACLAGQFAGKALGQKNSANPYEQETPAQHEARMKWFREARFGMFIHWGLFSQAAGEWNGKSTSGAGEWLMHDLQIRPTDYAKLVPQFDPEKFDAREWVRIAK